MKIKERLTQEIYPHKWGELDAIDKKFDAVESGLGFPPKKRYRLMVSSKSINILVIEREWESFAEFEKTYEKALASPEWNALGAEMNSIVKDGHTELLVPLP